MSETPPNSPAGAPSGGAADRADGERSGSDFHDAVARAVASIRPAIQADQGDILLRGTDLVTGVVSVELIGVGIDRSPATESLKDGLERILKQRVEGVTEVRHVGDARAGTDDGTPVSL